MKFFRIISQRSVDPFFYRRRYRRIRRRFRKLRNQPSAENIGSIGPIRTVTVFVAHPDDEVFCSGLICELKDSGAFVRVVCLTRGEGGPTGGNTRDELGSIRETEMLESCTALGVDDVVFLGHVDPVAKEFRVFAPAVSKEELALEVVPFFRESDLVLSHGSCGEYWHPAHLLVFDATRSAMEKIGRGGPAWFTFLAVDPEHPIPSLINKDDSVFLRIDVSRHFERREKALEAHGSQLGLFGRFAGGDHSDFVRKTGIESYALWRAGSLQVPETADEGESEHDRAGDAGGECAESKSEWQQCR